MSKESVVRNNIWKWIVLALLAAVSVHVTYPLRDVKNDKGEVVEHGKLRLGLDLSGGTSFTLGVDVDKLIV